MEQSTTKPLIQAAYGNNVDRYPIWFLRQAGRYLPEYRKMREGKSFLDMCEDPSVAAEITLQPLRRFDLDAAIIFADILLIPMAMGQDLSFGQGHGPILKPVVRNAGDIDKLKTDHISTRLGYVGEAIKKTKVHLKAHQTMIGFAGAPFTVATYMIEGGGSKNYTEAKMMAYRQPGAFKRLMEILGEATFEYLTMQVQSGAEMVMLFDSWAGNLAPDDYEEYVTPATARLTERLRSLNVPIVYFPGQGSSHFQALKDYKVDVIHLDWRVSPLQGIQELTKAGLNVTLQGNLDPQVLMGDEEFVRRKVRRVIESMKQAGVRAHIFNVGHGLMPHLPPESLEWVIDEVRKVKW